MKRIGAAVLTVAACGGAQSTVPLSPLRIACAPTQYWDGTRCTARGNGAKLAADARLAVEAQDPDKANAAFAAIETSGPIDHDTHVILWEQRGILAGFLEDKPASKSAFDMLLALDPGHLISYGLKSDVTLLFEAVRADTKKRRPPELDIAWPKGLSTSDAIPLDIEVIADPKQFLKSATVFVRTRGETTWRASDLALAPKPTRIFLPPVRATQPTSLELYLRAYDERGNEVLAWSDPTRPREIPLRYDPPPKWYRSWKTYAIGGTAAAVITGLIVYAVTLAPPDDADGTGVVK
jgi:hypothetical protein